MKRINFSSTYYNKLTPSPKTETFFWIFFILASLIKFIYFQFTTGLNAKPYTSSTNLLMLTASLSALIIFSSFVFLVFRKKRCIGLLVLDFLLTLILISDTIYFRYYSNSITVPVLFQVGLMGPLGESIKNLIKSSDVIYFFDFPVLLIGIFISIRKGFDKILIKKRLVFSLIGLAVGLIMFYCVSSNTNTLWFPYDKNYVSKQLGIAYFHYYDVKSYLLENVFVNKSLSSKEKATVTNYFETKNKEKTGTKFQGIAKNKNLIIVQLEAFQQFLINRKRNGKEITPNINKLISESLYFNNFFYQVGAGNTSDAEFLNNNSLYPAKESAAYFRYPSNTYHALPKLLKQQGYNAFAFHAYTASFWNRSVMYKTIGFDKFFSAKDYKPGERIGFGLNDTDFLIQSLSKIDKTKPFYSFMVTLSSHFAYAPFEYYSFDTGKYEHTELGNYFKAANYVDKSLGNFISELKKQGLYDNSVLVLYGDHFMMPKGKADQLLEYLNLDHSDFTWTKNEKVPLIIHYPGVKNGVTENITGGQIDIYPTVANLLGIDPQFAMGKDLLNSANGYVVLRNGSVITDKFVYVNEQKAAYDVTSGKILDKALYEKDLKEYLNELTISDLILKKNVFKAIK